MADIVSAEKRSEMMSGIRGKNTKPEIVVRRLLHRTGYRFRLHRKDLPGKPDIVLPKWRTIIFVNGCYWHGHENCHLFRPPKTRTVFWTTKIEGNRARDTQNYSRLLAAGWNIVIIWECAIHKSRQIDEEKLVESIENGLLRTASFTEIRSDTI